MGVVGEREDECVRSTEDIIGNGHYVQDVSSFATRNSYSSLDVVCVFRKCTLAVAIFSPYFVADAILIREGKGCPLWGLQNEEEIEVRNKDTKFWEEEKKERRKVASTEVLLNYSVGSEGVLGCAYLADVVQDLEDEKLLVGLQQGPGTVLPDDVITVSLTRGRALPV